MVFQPKYSLGLIFPDHTTPVESDSESITSTIPTKRQTKPSKIDQVGQVINNAGFHLVTNSGHTQPKIKTKSPAPPRPIHYPYTVIGQDPPGQYQEGTAPPALKPVSNTVYKPQRYVTPSDADDDEIGPEGMLPNTTANKTLLKSIFAGQPSTSPINYSATQKSTLILLSTVFPADTVDNDIASIAEGKSEPDPVSIVVVAPLFNSSPPHRRIKEKPSAKPIPTRVSNTY